MFCNLQLRLKELEEEAHQIAGERFLLTSSSQLREVYSYYCHYLSYLFCKLLMMQENYKAYKFVHTTSDSFSSMF